MLSGLVHIAGLPATLALAAPGLLAVPAPCRQRPVTLRPLAAFGVFHVLFPSRRASPEGMQQALIRFCVGAKIPAHGEIAKFFLVRAKTALLRRDQTIPNPLWIFFETGICNQLAFVYKRRTPAEPL